MAPQENPLVNNRKLRQLYVAMAGARVLNEYVTGTKGRPKFERIHSTHGEEACRVSTAIELVEGDLVSDAQAGVVMDFIAGATAPSLLHRITAVPSNTKKTRAKSATIKRAAQLPWIEDADERLAMAEGAALAFKTLKRPNLVVAYVRRGEAVGRVWRRVLGVASKFELPIIFVVLPDIGNRRQRVAEVRTNARPWRVPCIPVDAGDAVALYRVAQESIGRVRGEGGPVVIECVAHRLEGRKRKRIDRDDPILQMKDFMLGRNVCDKEWLDGVGEGFRRLIETAR